MPPDCRWRDVPGFGDITLRQPLSLFLPRFVETGCGEPGWMDSSREAALFGLLCECLSPLSDLAWTLEV